VNPRERSHSAFVYIMSNRSRRLYVGMTTDLPARVFQHRTCAYPNAFTARYKFYTLVYFEPQADVRAAAKREIQVKGWRREKKVALIQTTNPWWRDLTRDFADLYLIT
jgi:putative endonuclease